MSDLSNRPTLAPDRPPLSKRTRRFSILVGLVAVIGVWMAIRASTIQPVRVKPYLRDERVVVLAHQGASGHAPSNTIASYELGLKLGGDIIELDVHATKDGVLVVSHDDTLDRLTNGKGYIKDKTLAELQQVDFGYGFTADEGKTFPFRGKGVKVATLEEVFQRFPEARVNIELKQVDPPTEATTWTLVRQYHMEDKVLINSFHQENVKRWKQLAEERVSVGASKGDMYEFVAYYLLHLDWLYSPKADAFQLPTDQTVGPITIRFDTPRFIERAHKLGMKVHYWTINDEPTMRRLVELGADGLITDFPDRADKVLKEMGKR